MTREGSRFGSLQYLGSSGRGLAVSLCPWGELCRWLLGAEAWLGSEWELGMVTVDHF